ncbi:hypothetical protein [Nocardioides jejuensis]|uniref:Uncharacterized protein n=1 Tax=Nocardioides jejuensis TaxID=2502782 RepID=A0A4R1BY76_9ACTN|nr:hypothetical protein [Nocardioides jejuensis]TCJ23034.1 hypothetical protein EPD65_11775 [Nocardioides jejuensis]
MTDACRIHAPADDHHDTCPTCLAKVRDNLHEIARLIADLPAEAITKGLNSEAMNLLAPATDYEQAGHIEASIAAGRISPDDYDAATAPDLLHPSHVIGCWDSLVRDALEHTEPETWSVTTGIDYLDLQLTYLAGYEHLAFDELAADIRACRIHLEHVLHDGIQRDTGAPCPACSTTLRRTWGTEPALDGWECPACGLESSQAEYEHDVAATHRQRASWLTDEQMEIRVGVKAATVRSWGRRGGPVSRRRHSERTEYAVADVEAAAWRKGLAHLGYFPIQPQTEAEHGMMTP